MARKKSCNAAVKVSALCCVSGTGPLACRSPTADASACPANSWFGWWTFALRPTCMVLAGSVAISWAGKSYAYAAAWCRKWLCGQQDPRLSHRPCRKHCSGKRAVFLVRYGRGGCESCEGTVKNPAVCCQHTSRGPVFWERPSPTPLFT